MSNVLDLKAPPSAEEPLESEAVESQEVVEVQEDQALLDPLASLLTPQEIAWEAHHPLSGSSKQKHYIALAAFVLAGALIAFWQSSWLTFLVVVVGVAAWEVRERFSRPVSVVVDTQGVMIDDQHYPHAELASFDMHQMPDNTIHLSLKTNRWHLAHLRLPLGDQDHQEVIAVLSQYIPQERHPIPRLDYWIRS